MKSRPYALTEWLDSSASQIHGTSAAAVSWLPPAASRARDRKAWTLSAAGASPFRKSLRPGDEGGAMERLGRAGSWESVLFCSLIWFSRTLGAAGS